MDNYVQSMMGSQLGPNGGGLPEQKNDISFVNRTFPINGVNLGVNKLIFSTQSKVSFKNILLYIIKFF